MPNYNKQLDRWRAHMFLGSIADRHIGRDNQII